MKVKSRYITPTWVKHILRTQTVSLYHCMHFGRTKSPLRQQDRVDKEGYPEVINLVPFTFRETRPGNTTPYRHREDDKDTVFGIVDLRSSPTDNNL